MNRRLFLESTLLTAAAQALPAQSALPWGGPVIDIHVHPRREPGLCFAHNEGSGVSKAVLLTRVSDADKAKAEIDLHPRQFIWFAAADPAQPGAFESLQKALDSGARGIGEMKSHTAADAKEMRRVYDLCAERQVPVLIHFQEVAHFAGEGDFNAGFRQFDKILKAHSKTTFIGHADFFWANISADVPTNTGYPSGPVKVGGITDKWLAEYPNLYGDMSANSGNNAFSRDAEFARGFLDRHQNKLMFGSDCSCRDGHGTGGSPLLPRLKGKCVGRDTLGVAKQLATPEVFRKITWNNAARLLKMS